MTADVRKKVIESAKKCDIDFLAIAILDIGIKSKIASNQNRNKCFCSRTSLGYTKNYQEL